MQRSRLKNIANKSKEIMKPVVGEFEQFKNSLPIEIDDNYRLEAAWKAYGKPKNYQEALWEGLVQPLDDKTFKMPSIGYNEETEEYEYLNKGKENETVNRDIRVWDNDVIPFVKELKQGGYIRIYNDEKDCWTYSKNKLQETENKEIHESQRIQTQLNFFEDSILDNININKSRGHIVGNIKTTDSNKIEENYDNNNNINKNVLMSSELNDSYGDNILKNLNKYRKMALGESTTSQNEQ